MVRNWIRFVEERQKTMSTVLALIDAVVAETPVRLIANFTTPVAFISPC